MKNAIIGFISILILLVAGATISTVEGRTMRENEIESTLSTAMQQSMEILTLKKTYDIEDAKAFALDFIQSAMTKMNSKSNYDISVYSIDVKKGILDVEVTQHYDQFFKEGKVSCRKVILLENDADKEQFVIVNFVKNGKTVKTINISKGSYFPAVLLPKNVGVTSWKADVDGKIYKASNIGNFVITKNTTFNAT